jgi:hypothetical protein
VIVAPRTARPARGRDARPMHARRYRLTIEGELSDRAGSAFHGMTLTRDAGNTLLVGRVRDQAELHGVLQRVSDLGLTLLSAGVVEDEPGERADKERR